ncbi:MAG: SDR family oxidoreductase [Zavarzinia sp.]|nr:SDR family oxidoreductase [Zavarzinia sp.]
MDLWLEGRTVLITGASKGIGAAAAIAFAAEGCNLHLTARSADELAEVAAKARETARGDVSIVVHVMDLTAPGACKALTDAVGDIDIMLNNAGVIPGGDLDAIDEARWREGWELKVFGYIGMTRLVYKRMRERGRGVIINNIGNAGERYDADYVAGTTGNAALMAFTRALGGRSLDHGVRIVGVNPGPVDTDRIYKLLKNRAEAWLGDESQWPELQKRYPLGRPAHLREIVDLMLFLASDRSGYTSGAIFTVDGGITARASII